MQAPAPAPTFDRRIGWGLLGTGGIADQYLRALSCVADARLVAVGSRDAARARAFVERPRGPESPREPVRAYGSYAALVDDPEVDVVYIGTPHPDHVHSMRLALQAGKAVLCEKPFTVNRRDALACVALARERGTFLMEAMWMRCVPAMVELKRLLDAGAIGDVVAASADFGFAAAGLAPEHRALNPALGGGGLLDVGIYPLNFAAFVLGPIAGVQADAVLGPTGVDVHTVFNLRHANGGRSQGMCSLQATTPCRALVLGTRGRIEVEPPFYAAQRLRVVRGSADDSPVESVDLPWQGNRYVAQVREVQRCLRAGLAESPVMPLDESVALVGWLDAIRAQIGLRYPGE